MFQLSQRERLKGLLHTVECTLHDFGHLVPADQLAEIRAAVMDAERVLDEADSEDSVPLRAALAWLEAISSKQPPEPPQAIAARLAKPR